MAKLQGKIALVTGSSSGIGKAVAIAFANEGAQLALNYPEESQAENVANVARAVERLGTRAITLRADVSQEAAVMDLVANVVDTYGRIDILVNNAGTNRPKTMADTTADDYDAVSYTHLTLPTTPYV